MDKTTLPENRNVTEGTITFNFQKFLCRIGWHDWAKWQDIELTYTHQLTSKSSITQGQQRHCNECNKRQIRTET